MRRREREIVISRVSIGTGALVKPKKRDNSDRGAAKAEKLHGTQTIVNCFE